MVSVQHINTKAGAKPYGGLFSTVSIIPPNTHIAYISSQWACDPETGELVKGTENDAGKQAKIVFENVNAILKELGVGMKDIVHKTVCFTEFSDEKVKAVVEAQVATTPDEWKADMFSCSMTYRGVDHFHAPGMVYALDLVVALPNYK